MILSRRWRGLRFTEFELRQITAVRKELDAEYEAKLTPLGKSSHPRFPANLRLDPIGKNAFFFDCTRIGINLNFISQHFFREREGR
jgi:hypothetical protein